MKQHMDKNDAKAWFVSVVISSVIMMIVLIGLTWGLIAYYQMKHDQSNYKIIKTKHI